MEKNYDHSKESAITKAWETAKPNAGYLNPDNIPGPHKKKFVISMPPPNATGVLHLGHAARLTIEDIMTRFHRMRGDDTLWVPGTDHAAIATNAKVEQMVRKEGKTRESLGREKFLKRVREYVEDSKGTIRTQIRAMGASCDWSREQFTLSPELSRAVTKAFVDMYNAGLIYRGLRVVNWCPHCQSTLADDEVEYKEESAILYTFRYAKKFPLAISSTRPETKFGDAAVAVYPTDKRYKKYIGKSYTIALGGVERNIRVVADKSVDPAFGTGALGVTPAHSQTDETIAIREKLPFRKVIGEDGRMTQEAGTYAGLTVREAREKLIAELKEKGLVEKEESIQHNLSLCYRCGTAIEPLPSKQWFVAVNKPYQKGRKKYASLKKQAMQRVKAGEITILPERFNKTYFHWMENLHDWNISRQIWYGHEIPVWYKKKEVKRMGFHEDIVPEVLKGKTRTYRLRDHKFSVDNIVAFEKGKGGPVFGYGIIEKVQKITVGGIALPDKKHGGKYKTTAQLIPAFTRMYPDRKVKKTTPAWIYDYRFSTTIPDEASDISVSETPPKGRGWERDHDVLDTWFSSGLWTFSTLGWPEDTPDLKRFHPTTVMETAYDILFFWVARMILLANFCLDEKPFETVYLAGLIRDRQNRKMTKSLGNGIDPLPMIEKYGTDAVRLAISVGTTPGQDQQFYEEKVKGYRNFVNKLWNIARFAIPKIAEDSSQKLLLNTMPEKAIFSRLQGIVKEVTDAIETFQFGRAGNVLYEFVWHEYADWYLEIAKLLPNAGLLRETLVTTLKLLHPYMPFVTEAIWQELPPDVRGATPLIVALWPAPARRDEKAEQAFRELMETVSLLRRYRQYANLPENVPLSFIVESGDRRTHEADILKAFARLEWHTDKPVKRTRILPPTNIRGSFGTEIDQERLSKEQTALAQHVQRINAQLKNVAFRKKAPGHIIAELEAKRAQYQARLDEMRSLMS